MEPSVRFAQDGSVPLEHFPLREDSAVSQQVVLIASVVLGVILVPSLITVRPGYYPSEEEHTGTSPAIGGESATQSSK